MAQQFLDGSEIDPGPHPLVLPIRKGGTIQAGRLSTRGVYKILRSRAAKAGVKLRRAGIGFVSLREGIDSDGEAGWTVLELVKATAKLERSRVRRTGRPRVRVDMARLQDMHSRGLSLRQIARLLKVSKRSSGC